MLVSFPLGHKGMRPVFNVILKPMQKALTMPQKQLLRPCLFLCTSLPYRIAL